MVTRRYSTLLLALLTAMLTMTALAVALALPASAHSQLVSSTPGDGEELTELPDAVALEFNEDLQEIGTEITVAGPDGSEVASGDPQIDGATVSQPLDSSSTPVLGEYTVTWRVVSADGHPVSGELTFEVAGNTRDDVVEQTTEATTEPTTEDTAAEATSSPSIENISAGSDLAVPIIIAIVVLAAAAIVLLLVRRRRAR